jgi:mannose-6-phosphate isomerase
MNLVRTAEDKVVRKPWGKELWLADGTTTPYALKRILFLAGHRSSLQFHRTKQETNYILSGSGIFSLSKKPIDIEEFMGLKDKSEFIKSIHKSLQEIILESGIVIDVPAGYVHRVTAATDLTFIECSTTQLDDVIRIEDDSNRGNGRIESEH